MMSAVLEKTKQIPTGWEEKSLGDLTEYVTSGSRNWSKYYANEGALFIRTQDIKDNTLSSAEIPRVKLPEKVEGKRTLVKRGDLLITITGYIGRVASIDRKIEEAYVSQSVALARLKNPEFSKFIQYQLLTKQSGGTQLENMAYGMGRPVLNLQNIKDVRIWLPNYKTQKHIVAKIEELFSHIHAGIEALKKAKQLLKQYRQSVLKAAVTGELTKEWREANKDKLEPASQLLERILKERRQKWEHGQLRQFTAKGLPAPKKGRWWLYVLLCDDNSFYIGVTEDMHRRWAEHVSGDGAEHTKKHKPISIIHHEEFKTQKETYNREKELKTGFGRKWLKREYEKGTLVQAGKMPKDDKWKEKYKERISPEWPDLGELPEGWFWITIDQLASDVPRSIQSGPFGSNLKHSEFQETGKLVVGIDNVREGFFSIGSENRISEKKFIELEKYAARPGDVLITVMASIGRTCVIPDDLEPAIITKHIYRITVDKKLILPEYLNMCLYGAPSVVDQIFSQTIGQTRPGLNGSIIKGLCIPIPSTEEQRLILEKVNEKSDVINRLDYQLITFEKRSDKNKQSILASAFSGNLEN